MPIKEVARTLISASEDLGNLGSTLDPLLGSARGLQDKYRSTMLNALAEGSDLGACFAWANHGTAVDDESEDVGDEESRLRTFVEKAEQRESVAHHSLHND